MEVSPEKLEVLKEFLTENGSNSAIKKKPLKGIAKNMTIAILIITFIVGVVGNFTWANFEMTTFIDFLKTYAWFYIPLVGSIGVNSVVKKVKDKKIEEEFIKEEKNGN